MPFNQDFEQEIQAVLSQLANIQGIDPTVFVNLRKDVDFLEKTVKDNAKKFSANSKDISEFQKTIVKANKDLRRAVAGVKGQDISPLMQNFRQGLSTYYKKFVDMSHKNSKTLAANDKVLEEQNGILKAQNRYKKQQLTSEERKARIERMLENDRIREEKNYIKKMQVLNSRREALTSRIIGLEQGFSRSEVRQQDRSIRLAESNRSSTTRKSASIAGNIVGNIPDFGISKIRVRAGGHAKGDSERSLFSQLQDLKTAQTGKRIRDSRKEALGIAEVRHESNPLLRIYKSMALEAKSPKSRLIIANIFKDGFITPIKLATKAGTAIIKESFIRMLNAPFVILKNIGQSFANVFGDSLAFATGGKEAYDERVSARKIALDERRMDAEEAFNEKLGVGIDRLIDALETYSTAIQSPSYRDASREVAKRDLELLNSEISGLSRDQVKIDSSQIKVSPSKEEVPEKVEVKTATPEKPKNTMARAWQIAKDAASKHGGKPSEFFAESLKMAHEEKSSQVSQVNEQRLDEEARREEIKVELLKSIDSKLDESAFDQEGQGKGLFGGVGKFLEGVMEKVKGIGSTLLTALGLGAGGKLAMGAKGALGAAGKAIPLVAMIYSSLKAFTETNDEFVSQGNYLDDTLERFRLLTQNFVTAIPGLFDDLMMGLFGFETNLKGWVDRFFKSLNTLGSNLGLQLFDLLEDIDMKIFEVQRKINKKIKDLFFPFGSLGKEGQESKEKMEGTLGKLKAEAEEQMREVERMKMKTQRLKEKYPTNVIHPTIPEPTSSDEMDSLSSLPIRVTSFDSEKDKHDTNSLHYSQQALDITPLGHRGLKNNNVPLQKEDPEAYAAYKEIENLLKNEGLKVYDEWSSGEKKSEHGGYRHIHVSGDRDKILNVLARAQIVKPGAIQPAPNMSEAKTRESLRQESKRLNKTKRLLSNNTNTESKTKSTPITFKVPPPSVILDRDMDVSFNFWKYNQEMQV